MFSLLSYTSNHVHDYEHVFTSVFETVLGQTFVGFTGSYHLVFV